MSAVLAKTSAAECVATVSVYDGTNTSVGEALAVTSQSNDTYEWDFEQSPTGGLWTQALLNSLEVKIAASNTNVQCDKLTAAVYFVSDPLFKYEKPTSEQDGQQGKVCKVSGMWAPRHAMQGEYIIKYLPDEERGIKH